MEEIYCFAGNPLDRASERRRDAAWIATLLGDSAARVLPLSEEITVDPEELAEARWFHRDEIRAMVARAASGPDDPTQLSLPGPVAIAHHICRRWSNGVDSL